MKLIFESVINDFQADCDKLCVIVTIETDDNKGQQSMEQEWNKSKLSKEKKHLCEN